MKKEPQIARLPPPPYSSLLLSVLHQKKALGTFHRKGQRSIVERNIGLEYALARYWNSNFMSEEHLILNIGIKNYIQNHNFGQLQKTFTEFIFSTHTFSNLLQNICIIII